MSETGQRMGAIAGAVGVIALASASLFGLTIQVRDLAALLFPAVSAGLLAHGWRAQSDCAPRWTAPALTGAPARVLGGVLFGLFLVLFCRPRAWGFAGHVDGDTLWWLDVVGSVALTVAWSAVALAGALRWLREGDLPERVLASSFPLIVLPGLAWVHGTGSSDGAATWMTAYAWAVALALWRSGRASTASRSAGALLAVAASAARLLP